jgi:deoxycytidylate deaminase
MNSTEYYRNVAVLTSQRAIPFGKCGCVIVDNQSDSIASTGYNTHLCHAEESAISSCHFTRNGTYTMFVSLSPCMDCAKRIINSTQIKNVYYGDLHPDLKYECKEALEVLKNSGIKVQHWRRWCEL